MNSTKLVALDDVIETLTKLGYMKGNKLIQPKKPGHGACCTCQTCGYPYDFDCVCEHNQILSELMKLL